MKEPQTLRFDKYPINSNYRIPLANVFVPRCGVYILKREQEVVGMFYSDLSFSFADFGTIQFKIEQVNRRFSRPQVFAYDFFNGLEIAQLHYSLPFDSTSAKVEIKGKPKFYWHRQDYETVNLFKPHTWGAYQSRMSNGRDELVVKGRLGSSERWNCSRNDLPFTGTVTIKEEIDYLSLICCLYVVECDLAARDLDT